MASMSRHGWVLPLLPFVLACARDRVHASPASATGAVSAPMATIPSVAPSSSSTAAAAPQTVALRAKYGGTCALGVDGSIRCWGSWLELHPWDEGTQKHPFLVPLGGRALHLALADSLACALL